jgi:tetratricopeptide (TPR) repeat protein
MTVKQVLGLFILLICSISPQIHAQTVLHIKNGCHFDGDETPKDIYGYDPSNEAVQIISRITAAIGLEQNYTIRAANVSNALASTEGGQRYILYNTTFLENFKRDAQTRWAAYCVLAHEIGHHLNNHDFTETDAKKRKLLELAADRFAGNILQKMGATLAEAQAGINTFSLDETKTHPPKSARLEAIAVGWKQSQEKEAEKGTPQYSEPKPKIYDEKKAQEWLDKAFNENDDREKIKYLTTALEYKPDDANALYNRGIAKSNLHKYNEAIIDYSASITLNNKDDNVFYSKGIAKSMLDKYLEAINDFDEAIKLNPNYSSAFNSRGWSKYKLGKNIEAIIDYNRAIDLQPSFSEAFTNRSAAKYQLGKFNEAIIDCDQSIHLDPNNPKAFFSRARSKYQLNKYNEAINDYNETIRLKPNDAESFNYRGLAKMELKQFSEAILDYDQAINLDSKFARVYANKGCCLIKMNNLNRFGEAIDLIDKALAIDANIPWAKDCKREALKKLKN